MAQVRKVLLCEDDENLGMLLVEYLQAKNFVVDLCANGVLGYRAFLKEKYDICLLDVMMPEKDGFTLAQDLRAVNAKIPIIFLSAKTLKEDVVEGFKLGADDYLTKPFSMEELVFRMEAVLRRVSMAEKKRRTMFNIGKYVFDATKKSLFFGDEAIRLTTKENELLLLLANSGNNILERNFTLKTIWVDDNYFNARSMDVYITKLRKVLKDDPSVGILNVHGKGYKLIYPQLEQTVAEMGE